ncbi:hypothetical protein GCM10029976_035930 [Kribbella albertanoniae]
MLVDAGWPPDRIGIVVGIVASTAGIAGAVGGGLLTRRYGRSRVLALSCAAQAVALSAFLPLSSGFAPLVFTVTVLGLFGGVYAAGSVAATTVIMDLSRRELAAGDFTILTSLGFFVSLAAGAISVTLANHLGYRPVLLAAITLVVTAAIANSRQPDPAGRSLSTR